MSNAEFIAESIFDKEGKVALTFSITILKKADKLLYIFNSLRAS